MFSRINAKAPMTSGGFCVFVALMKRGCNKDEYIKAVRRHGI